MGLAMLSRNCASLNSSGRTEGVERKDSLIAAIKLRAGMSKPASNKVWKSGEISCLCKARAHSAHDCLCKPTAQSACIMILHVGSGKGSHGGAGGPSEDTCGCGKADHPLAGV